MVDSETTQQASSAELAALLRDRVRWTWSPSTHGNTRQAKDSQVEGSVSQFVSVAMQNPIGFPSLTDAVVQGDRVVLAVDPTLPGLLDVVESVVECFGGCDLESIEIVLAAEASDDLMMDLASRISGNAKVIRHDTSHRESLMYLMADEAANPVYLNRQIVDADFVLPIRTQRHVGDPTGRADALSSSSDEDPTGVFPTFADSATRLRLLERASSSTEDRAAFHRDLFMTLGVQAVMEVEWNERGQLGRVICGTPDELRKHASDSPPTPRPESPVSVAIACLDGDGSQQTWANLTRAVWAACHAVDFETLVVWTTLSETPSPALMRGMLSVPADVDEAEINESEAPEDAMPDGDVNGDGFPDWSDARQHGLVLRQLLRSHRILLRCSLSDETIEDLGFGVVASMVELDRLIESGSSCGILPAAQYMGPHLMEVQS
ncbi:MAG: lactate racemase domain-containing protein [Planctomycetota bacterium]